MLGHSNYLDIHIYEYFTWDDLDYVKILQTNIDSVDEAENNYVLIWIMSYWKNSKWMKLF